MLCSHRCATLFRKPRWLGGQWLSVRLNFRQLNSWRLRRAREITKRFCLTAIAVSLVELHSCRERFSCVESDLTASLGVQTVLDLRE